MSCFIEEKDGQISATLSFARDQLLYDIRNCAYIEGHVMDESNIHQRHMVKDVGEDGNVDRVTRILDLAVAKCREMLYPYTKHGVHKSVLDDKLREVPVYGIVLQVPESFSQTTLNLLERLIHEYLVDCAVAEWLSITHPTKAVVWEAKSKEIETEIRSNIHTRMRKVRLKMHPF